MRALIVASACGAHAMNQRFLLEAAVTYTDKLTCAGFIEGGKIDNQAIQEADAGGTDADYATYGTVDGLTALNEDIAKFGAANAVAETVCTGLSPEKQIAMTVALTRCVAANVATDKGTGLLTQLKDKINKPGVCLPSTDITSNTKLVCALLADNLQEQDIPSNFFFYWAAQYNVQTLDEDMRKFKDKTAAQIKDLCSPLSAEKKEIMIGVAEACKPANAANDAPIQVIIDGMNADGACKSADEVVDTTISHMNCQLLGSATTVGNKLLASVAVPTTLKTDFTTASVANLKGLSGVAKADIKTNLCKNETAKNDKADFVTIAKACIPDATRDADGNDEVKAYLKAVQDACGSKSSDDKASSCC